MTYRMEQKEEIRIVGIRTPMTEDMDERSRKTFLDSGRNP